MRALKISFIVLASVLFFMSCQKNETPLVIDSVRTDTIFELVADTIIGLSNGQPVGAGKFTFFSIETNSVISDADSNSTKWDIGVRGTTIITNSGNSGPGFGGAFVYNGTFGELTSISADSVFRVDNAPTAYAIPTGSNKGWYVYDFPTNLINPIPGRVLVIRTANGNYAKVEIYSYYRGGTPSANVPDDEKLARQRFYTFGYTYQSDGSKVF